MSKSDAAMKKKLDTIGDVGKLKRRRFIDSSTMDQKPWISGGLSFGKNRLMYGSCDFAWFANEKWHDPFSGKDCEQKPYLVVEATDCLNTRSWGSAQIQRFHHALGPFLCGVNAVYYLNKGPSSEQLRPYLTFAAYTATQIAHSQGQHASYLVTTELSDVKKLVILLAKEGNSGKNFQKKVNEILQNMINYFNATFSTKPYFGNWEKYLASRDIFRLKNKKWVKIIGARERSFSDSSQRYGHIILGEAITSKYLLAASGCFDIDKDYFYYLMPLINASEISNLDLTRKTDKEWNLLRRSDKSWKVTSYDSLSDVNTSISNKIPKFRKANLNKVRKEWNLVKNEIVKGLKDGTIKLN